MFRIFVINPGSTSTKLSLFEDDKSIWEKKVFHDSSQLSKFSCINDQLDYRFEMIMDFLKEEKISLEGIDAIVARGGASATVESGVLADVAPSILHIMGIEQPEEMTGKCLIKD